MFRLVTCLSAARNLHHINKHVSDIHLVLLLEIHREISNMKLFIMTYIHHYKKKKKKIDICLDIL